MISIKKTYQALWGGKSAYQKRCFILSMFFFAITLWTILLLSCSTTPTPSWQRVQPATLRCFEDTAFVWQIAEWREQGKLEGGDCVTYALLKYEFLKATGENPVLIIGEVKGFFGGNHLLCAIYDNDDNPLVYDNGGAVGGEGKYRANEVRKFRPLYAFDENETWGFKRKEISDVRH